MNVLHVFPPMLCFCTHTQALGKLPTPPSTVAVLPHNKAHNRFKNIYPCELLGVCDKYKWKNHFYEMKGDVGMSVHEKERKQEDAYTKTQTHS